MFYAHSITDKGLEEWQSLEEHLENVAKLARIFAKPFGGEEWAYILGSFHDIGKGTLPWQAYIRKANNIIDDISKQYIGKTEHSIIGGQLLHNSAADAGKLLAYCIAGHHGGLHNWYGDKTTALESKIKEQLHEIKFEYKPPVLPNGLPLSNIDKDRFGFQLQFFIRMLFSCLVDADFLDTELFMDKNKADLRTSFRKLSDLYDVFWYNFNELRNNVKETKVNLQREVVLADCLLAAENNNNIFSLTVPTGGGKTLASMAFALEYAKKYNKERIIYVIPFTSIIEQNANVFTKMFGDNAVLEHHCNFITNDTDWTTKMATENWDAPIVITTNVQFFDSFFSHKTSKCRKLHNVSNSIIIFDEVQAIPVNRLSPCIEVIKELSTNYGAVSVLCTATQPVINFSDSFKAGLQKVHEIINDIPSLFNVLKRTEEKHIGDLTTTEIAKKISEKNQALCIVNTRQQAIDIFNALPESDSNIHLSALMYPKHRSLVIDNIRYRLDNNLPCVVISTQLIEAGVDIDFPCVFRSISGIDSIAQAAGRCNRNGISEKLGDVSVFTIPNESKRSFFRKAAQSAEKLFKRFDGNLTSPECVREYFSDYFWKNQQNMDEYKTIELCNNSQRGNIQFRDISEFKMINNITIPIIIAVDHEAANLVRQLKFTKYNSNIFRKLQKYSVQIYQYQLDEIKHWLEEVLPDIWVLHTKEMYSDKTGLLCESPEGAGFFV